jgi:hypothetical protein
MCGTRRKHAVNAASNRPRSNCRMFAHAHPFHAQPFHAQPSHAQPFHARHRGLNHQLTVACDVMCGCRDSIGEDELLGHVQRLNADPAVHGILVQLPLPSHINEQNIVGVNNDSDQNQPHIFHSFSFLPPTILLPPLPSFPSSIFPSLYICTSLDAQSTLYMPL